MRWNNEHDWLADKDIGEIVAYPKVQPRKCHGVTEYNYEKLQLEWSVTRLRFKPGTSLKYM
jgi:hypothetical protein